MGLRLTSCTSDRSRYEELRNEFFDIASKAEAARFGSDIKARKRDIEHLIRARWSDLPRPLLQVRFEEEVYEVADGTPAFFNPPAQSAQQQGGLPKSVLEGSNYSGRQVWKTKIGIVNVSEARLICGRSRIPVPAREGYPFWISSRSCITNSSGKDFPLWAEYFGYKIRLCREAEKNRKKVQN